MLYHFFEATQAALSPWRAAAHMNRLVLSNPANPFSYSYPAKAATATLDVLEAASRQYPKPAWNIDAVQIAGEDYPVEQHSVARRAFCQLLRFDLGRGGSRAEKPKRPRMLVVAPLSGHHATLLRGTVARLVEDFDVFVTDWTDARTVAHSAGAFGLDDYIEYVMDFMREVGPYLHVLAVCQPGPAVLAATALLAAQSDVCQPATVTLMGSPIDTRKSPTEPNLLAKSKPFEWFRDNLIMRVPFPNRGAMRSVYPGFLQLSGFMNMNLKRHLSAHQSQYENLLRGNRESVAAHREFYDEYLAVMDLPAEYFLDTIRVVFQEHQIAEGTMRWRDTPVDLGHIRATALMTVEGENDDISGIGQTQAAHDLCVNIPARKRLDYVQSDVGHYGVFNGRRWRTEIAPRILDFALSHPVPVCD